MLLCDDVCAGVGKSKEVNDLEEVSKVREREAKGRFEANHAGEPRTPLRWACLATNMRNDTTIFTVCQLLFDSTSVVLNCFVL